MIRRLGNHLATLIGEAIGALVFLDMRRAEKRGQR